MKATTHQIGFDTHFYELHTIQKKRKQDLLSAKQAQPGPPTVPSHSELLQAQRLFPLKATQGKVKEAIENTHKVFS